MNTEEQTHLLQKGDKVYHLPSRRGATVQHVSVQRSAVLLRFAGGEERSRPVDEVRAYDPKRDEWSRKCRVE